MYSKFADLTLHVSLKMYFFYKAKIVQIRIKNRGVSYLPSCVKHSIDKRTLSSPFRAESIHSIPPLSN